MYVPIEIYDCADGFSADAVGMTDDSKGWSAHSKELWEDAHCPSGYFCACMYIDDIVNYDASACNIIGEDPIDYADDFGTDFVCDDGDAIVDYDTTAGDTTAGDGVVAGLSLMIWTR